MDEPLHVKRVDGWQKQNEGLEGLRAQLELRIVQRIPTPANEARRIHRGIPQTKGE